MLSISDSFKYKNAAVYGGLFDASNYRLLLSSINSDDYNLFKSVGVNNRKRFVKLNSNLMFSSGRDDFNLIKALLGRSCKNILIGLIKEDLIKKNDAMCYEQLNLLGERITLKTTFEIGVMNSDKFQNNEGNGFFFDLIRGREMIELSSFLFNEMGVGKFLINSMIKESSEIKNGCRSFNLKPSDKVLNAMFSMGMLTSKDVVNANIFLIGQENDGRWINDGLAELAKIAEPQYLKEMLKLSNAEIKIKTL